MENRKRILNELKSKGIKTIVPNLFTAVRLIGAVKIPVDMMTGSPEEAALFAALCGLSDAVDGKVARKLDAETEFGALFDAFVDKLFALGVIIPLLEKDPKWALILLSEAAISAVNMKNKKEGIEVKSSIQGKIKTVVLFATVALTYLNEVLNLKDPKTELFLTGLFGATMTMEIITLAGYIKTREKNKTLTKENSEHKKIDEE